MICYVDFLEAFTKPSNFSLQGFGKITVLVLNDFSQKEEKLEVLIWRIIARHWRKLKRIQDPNKFTGT